MSMYPTTFEQACVEELEYRGLDVREILDDSGTASDYLMSTDLQWWLNFQREWDAYQAGAMDL